MLDMQREGVHINALVHRGEGSFDNFGSIDDFLVDIDDIEIFIFFIFAVGDFVVDMRVGVVLFVEVFFVFVGIVHGVADAHNKIN